MKKLLIIGGYGNVGQLLASYLLKYLPKFDITLAGRNIDRAKKAAFKLMEQYPDSAVSALKVDVSDKDSLVKALSEMDMVVVASSTINNTQNVVEAALETQTDYLDTQLSSPSKFKVLNEYKDLILNENLTFITDGGYHPGIPGAMIHWAKKKLGSLNHSKVYAALRMDWSLYDYTDTTVKEMLEEFKMFDPTYLANGKWERFSFSDSSKWDFGTPYGKLSCFPMMMEEIKEAPSHIEELKNTGFFISGFNKTMDYFVMPILMTGINILPSSMYKPFAKLMKWGLKQGKPPYGVKLVADCKGDIGALQLSVAHEDGYEITVIPVVACLKQYLAGKIGKGLQLQAWAVEPEQFFKDMQQMGVEVSVEGHKKEPVSLQEV